MPMVIVFVSKKELRFLGFLLAIGCLTGMIAYQWRATIVQGWLRQITVVIDPGHGGVDGGAQDSRGNLEKDINLVIGRHVAAQLRQSGLRVVLTRRTDTDLAPFRSGHKGRHRRDLLRRIEIARRQRCPFLVSIHCDASTESRKTGAFVFYNWRSPQSKRLADAIQLELNEVQKQPGKIAPGKYFVIRQKGLTGVLVEVGYLSNLYEGRMLQDLGYQAAMGLAIAKGILGFVKTAPPQGSQFKVMQTIWKEFTNRWLKY
jgi:N-acetylmuramoyl-L-alanine amidase